MQKLLLSIPLIFLTFSASAQQLVLNWAKSFDNPNNFGSGNGRTVGVDGAGNVYSAGLFEHTLDFDPGPGVYLMEGGSPSKYGIYISKLDAKGNFVWAKQIPTIVEFGQIELKVDNEGNIYLTSDLKNAADMDPGPDVLMMKPTGFRDVFVVKLNTDGKLIWAKQFGGPGDTGPQPLSIDVDKFKNVIVAGIFNNTVDFDPGPGTFNLTSSAHFQAFIVKLNSNGELIWAKQFGNGPEVYSGCSINDMKFNVQGEIIMTGSFARTCDFDPGPAVYNLTSSPGSLSDGFICKLDANGNFKWVKAIGQSGGNNSYISPMGIEIDGLDNIITTGYFIGNFDFDPGSGVRNFSANPNNCYILKLDAQGNYVWVKIIGGDESDTGNDVVVDALNNVYVIGSFGTSVDFDPGPGTYIINSPHYGADVVVKLNSDGGFLLAKPFQSIDYGTTIFRRMDIDPVKNVYVAGVVGGIVDFDPGPEVFPLYGYGPFVLKLSPCLNQTESILYISTCDNYTLNNQTYDSTGTYYQTLLNSTGCDSLITLNLTINKKITEQDLDICEGEYFLSGGKKHFTGGIYFDTLKTTAGCDSIVITHLTVNPKPLPNLGADRDLCRNTLLAITPGKFTSYQWQNNSTIDTFYIMNQPGIYWVKVSNDYNCFAIDTMEVKNIMNVPIDFLKNTDTICNYEKLNLTPFGSYKSYLWSTGEITKTIQVQQPGNYWLKVTDDNGCIGIDSTILMLRECMVGVYVPNAFTPDKNGKNDIFKPMVFGNLIQYHFLIYNRWGNIVFQTNDPQKGWDGTFDGKPQNPSTFVWKCMYELEGEKPKIEKGTVLLIR
jgi:gliding motility-associated-like protein